MSGLQDSVSVLSGVGQQRQDALASLGISTVEDLLYYFPFRYEDLKMVDIADAADGEKVTLKGTVVSEAVVSRFGPRKTRTNLRLLVDHDVIMVTFFNQPYLKDKFETGAEVAIYGKWDAKTRRLTGMKVLAVQTEDSPSFDGIYPVNKNIRQSTLVMLIKAAYDKYHDQLVEVIPTNIRTHYRLVDVQQLIHDTHFPDSQVNAAAARRTAIFREFFLYQLQMQTLKQRNQKPDSGIEIHYSNQRLKAFIKTLPFELTDAQKKVVNEICVDMHHSIHMNRLLQGDVGSGKTIVAAIVMYGAVTAGFQAALMVPTEILAEQHYQNLCLLFRKLPVNVVLLTGSTKTKERRTIDEAMVSGQAQIVIGTHALIQDNVNFQRLGLVVIDEQHRFGVNQRRILREKGQNPDVLAMTATPIPRTMAITAYGEMDISTIDSMPKGRKPIETTWVRSNQIQGVLDKISAELKAGHQAFAITPLIAESEKIDLKNAEEIFEKLSTYFEPRYHVALLHGKMKPDEKNDIMNQFSENKIQILVSTTVVEVGVDVPNATVMMIFDADRFGLSQLHQLRGRVGRGKEQAYCMLIANPKTQVAIERMKIMTETNNGFILSQKDLELRGPGDVFGEKQSGLPEFKVGDPIADFNALQVAQEEIKDILKSDPQLVEPTHHALRAWLAIQQQRHLALD